MSGLVEATAFAGIALIGQWFVFRAIARDCSPEFVASCVTIGTIGGAILEHYT